MDERKTANEIDIIDIGGSQLQEYFVHRLQKDFVNPDPGKLPFVSGTLTSSDEGMQTWSRITSLPSWYQTREEIALLEKWGAQIAKHVQSGAHILDLGSGDVKKVIPLLDAIEALERHVTYVSVDVAYNSIRHGLETLLPRYKHIRLVGFWGTFDDAIQLLPNLEGPRFLVCFGAEIANDPWEIAKFDLRAWSSAMRPSDCFLLSVDSTQDREKVWNSYHDNDVFEKFLRDGLLRTNEVLGLSWYRHQDWEMAGKLESDPLCHSFVFTALRDIHQPDLGISFSCGEQIECYSSHRYTPEQIRQLFKSCQMKEVSCWQAPVGDMADYLLVRESDIV